MPHSLLQPSFLVVVVQAQPMLGPNKPSSLFNLSSVVVAHQSQNLNFDKRREKVIRLLNNHPRVDCEGICIGVEEAA